VILLHGARQGSSSIAVSKNTRDEFVDDHGIPNDEIKSRYKFLEDTCSRNGARDAISERQRVNSLMLKSGIMLKAIRKISIR